MKGLENLNVVVTGGSLGIGKETVKAFLEAGSRVVFTARREEHANEVLKEFAEYKDRLHFFKSDVRKKEDVKALVEFTKTTLGGCGAIVNNAGVFVGGELHESTEEDFDFLFDVNVKGVFNMCKYFLPMMLEAKTGAIVNIASVAGTGGWYNMALYSATKAAVISLSRSIAMDYAGKGIRSNCICPSATATPMFLNGATDFIMDTFKNAIPTGRLGTPQEVASAIKFLVSEDASFVNGQYIAVDGGLSCWSGEPRQDKEY